MNIVIPTIDEIPEYFVVQHQCWNGMWFDVDSTKHKTLASARKCMESLGRRKYDFVTRFRVVQRNDSPRKYLTVGCSQ